jgi:hypothetical protein
MRENRVMRCRVLWGRAARGFGVRACSMPPTGSDETVVGLHSELVKNYVGNCQRYLTSCHCLANAGADEQLPSDAVGVRQAVPHLCSAGPVKHCLPAADSLRSQFASPSVAAVKQWHVLGLCRGSFSRVRPHVFTTPPRKHVLSRSERRLWSCPGPSSAFVGAM